MSTASGTNSLLGPRLAAVGLLALLPGCLGGANAPTAPPATPRASPAAPMGASSGASKNSRAARAEPEIVDDFALLDQAGEYHRLYANGDARAIVLVSYAIGCPILRWSLPRLEELSKAYAERGVRFLYIDAGRHDDRAALAAEVREFGISAPILADEAQLVLSALRVRRTAEAILVDPRDWHVAYRGKIDDRATYGGQTGGTPVEHLDLALEAFLEGLAIAVPRTEPEGCIVFYEDADAPTPSYSTAIAPILAERCVGCHKDGGVAPWAMDSFERVQRWSPMIREVVRTKRMPPWHADPHVGTFENDRSLALDEASALVRWIEAGSPRGDGPDPLLEPVPQEEEWPLGPPDLVLDAKEQHVPAAGIVPYRYDAADIVVEEDMWVRGAHLKPSNYPVLHHAVILVKYPEHLAADEPEYQSGVTGYFALYVPSMRPRMFPEGTGKFIPKGSRILFQFHYTPTGKPEVDRPKLGLYLLDEEPPITYASTSAVRWDLDIPPGEAHYEAMGRKKFLHDVLVFDLIPHMHYRGKTMRYEAHYPDGSVEVLLSVPNYDFNWQTSYHLAEPKFLPAGTVVQAHALFDNSTGNPYNPDPNQRVVWGTQSTDEMLTGYMNYHLVPEPGGE